ncbi:MAG: hypothetical protein H7Y15_08695 [Pseudonocardia sp.]|nr:hypothetical protein [Pseudonocardia sp.]
MSRSRASKRGLLLGSALLTVLVAVFSDVAVGEAAVHVATLGAIVAAMGALRVRLAGRDRGLLQFLSGALLAQPVLHATAKLIPHGSLDHGAGAQVGQADLLVSGTQLAAALLIVAVVSFAEQLVTMLCSVIRVCGLRIRQLVPRTGPTTAHQDTPVRAALSIRYRPIAMCKRGPPRAYALAV